MKVLVPIIPPPPGEDWRYSVLLDVRRGVFAEAFESYNAASELEGVVRQFNTVGEDVKPDKLFLPLRYGTLEGFTGWHTKGWKGKGVAPFYRLPQLLAAPDAPVLVTEGEREADAAARLFPDLAAISPMNGAQAPNKTDWRPLRGRTTL